MNAPTLREVGKLAGVSAKTASNVLNGTETAGRTRFSPDAARRVREAAKQLSYTRNRFARAMRTKQSDLIGFAAVNYSKQHGKILNWGIFPLLVGLNHALTPLGKHVALVELDEFELASNQLPTVLKEPFFDGLIIHFGLSERILHLLGEFTIPRVYWDSGLFEANDCVYREEDKVASTLTDRLIAAGHRRIAFLVGVSEEHYRNPTEIHHFSVDARNQGYRQSMERAGLQPLVVLGDNAHQLADRLLQEKCTAVLLQNGDHLSLLWPALERMDATARGSFAALACDIETSIVKTVSRNIGGATYDRLQAGLEVAGLLLRKLAAGGAPVPSINLPFEIRTGDFLVPRFPESIVVSATAAIEPGSASSPENPPAC